jgi:hypothetical protein
VACWKPYAANSVWKQPLPANPKTAANQATILTTLGSTLSAGPDNSTSGRFSGASPTYFAQANDPLFTLHCTESWGTCNFEGMQIRVPDKAKWECYTSCDWDQHMVVVEPDGWEYDFWGVSRKDAGGGQLVCRWGGRIRIDGTGIDPIAGDAYANAAGTGMLAGMIRPEEWVSGQINHPIYISLPGDNGSGVYPSNGHHGSYGGTAWPPMGTRLQLQITDAEIAANPAWARPVLRAARDYGLIMEDTGSFSLWEQGGIQFDVFGTESPLTTYFRNQGLGWWDPDQVYVAHWNNLSVDWTRMKVIDPCVSARTC